MIHGFKPVMINLIYTRNESVQIIFVIDSEMTKVSSRIKAISSFFVIQGFFESARFRRIILFSSRFLHFSEVILRILLWITDIQ